MNKLFRLLPLLLLISGICIFPVMSVFADGQDDTEKNEIDISLSPKENLFNISNMKPGDWAPRTITVGNSGIKDFDYEMELRNDGETKLFNELLLEIKVGDTELYQGNLSEFRSVPARKLLSGSDENLDITIRFPEHLGNDFQGLDSSFAFVFIAEGKEKSSAVEAEATGQIGSSDPKSSGFTLPATSTSIFNLFLFGAALVVAGIVMMIVRHRKRIKPA